MRLDHLLSKESCPKGRVSRSSDRTIGPQRRIPSWCTGYSATQRRRRMELSGSPTSADRCRRPLFRFEGVQPHSPLLGDQRPCRKPRAQLGGRWESASPACRLCSGGVQPEPTTPAPLENCIASTSIFVLPSYKEPTVDALASTTDEGRG